MAVIPCASEGLRLNAATKFVALDGTRTFGVQMRDVNNLRFAGGSPIRWTITSSASVPASCCCNRAWRSGLFATASR